MFADSIWALLCPAIILGVIFTNIFTTAEAAAVSVVYAVIVSLFIYKTVNPKELWNTILGSVKAVAKLAMLLAFAVSFSKLLAAYGLDVVIPASFCCHSQK